MIKLMLLDTLGLNEVHWENGAGEDAEAYAQRNAYLHSYIESFLCIYTFLSKDETKAKRKA